MTAAPFYAKGDNATDDTDAIQAAIDLCGDREDGGTVLLPTGFTFMTGFVGSTVAALSNVFPSLLLRSCLVSSCSSLCSLSSGSLWFSLTETRRSILVECTRIQQIPVAAVKPDVPGRERCDADRDGSMGRLSNGIHPCRLHNDDCARIASERRPVLAAERPACGVGRLCGLAQAAKCRH